LIELKRKLILTEGNVAESQATLRQKETRNDEDRRELFERKAKIETETQIQREIDSERIAFDSTISTLETVESGQKDLPKQLEDALKLYDDLTHQISELSAQNYNLEIETDNKQKEIGELEKKTFE